MMLYREAERCEKVAENPARKIRHREEENSRLRDLSADEENGLRLAIRQKYTWHEPEFDIACTPDYGWESSTRRSGGW